MSVVKQNISVLSGNSSVGRAQPCQGWGREFESRFPLQVKKAVINDDGFFLLFEAAFHCAVPGFNAHALHQTSGLTLWP